MQVPTAEDFYEPISKYGPLWIIMNTAFPFIHMVQFQMFLIQFRRFGDRDENQRLEKKKKQNFTLLAVPKERI